MCSHAGELEIYALQYLFLALEGAECQNGC